MASSRKTVVLILTLGKGRLTVRVFEKFYISSTNLSSLPCDLGSLSQWLLSNRADSLVLSQTPWC